MTHARLIFAVLLLGSASQAESRSSAATADTSVNVIRTQGYRAIAAQQLKRLQRRTNQWRAERRQAYQRARTSIADAEPPRPQD